MCTIAGITYLAAMGRASGEDERDEDATREELDATDVFSSAAARKRDERKPLGYGGLFSDAWHV